MADILDTEMKFLPGIGPKRAEMLCRELNISTFRDMINFFPFRWIDKSQVYAIKNLSADSSYIQVRGKITNSEILIGQNGKKRLSVTLQDATGSMSLVFFSGIKWAQERIKTGEEYIAFGKVTEFNGKFSMVHPELSNPSQAVDYGAGSMVGIYSITERMRSGTFGIKAITKAEHLLLEKVLPYIKETLPEAIIKQKDLCPLKFALKNIHFPSDTKALEKAQERLKFEELFYLQLTLLRQKHARKMGNAGFKMAKVGDNFNKCYAALPYALTGAQKRVIRQMREDMLSGRQMNRLLQGDVGSGKTLVATLIALLAIDNGCQACIMAPTEVLANQHLANISKFLAPTGVRVALLSGSVKGKGRKEIFRRLASGEIDLIIGTHALIEEKVIFKRLGLAIIDEQHRFGVAQRAKLWNKNDGAFFPHVLVMTATPIPRTLAMTLYGDLDVSIIDELPPGRKEVTTLNAHEKQRERIYNFLKQQIDEGRQVFIVYPLIKESEKMDYANLEAGYEEITREFPAPKYITAVVHGKQKPEDKEYDMQLFASGRANILVATSVIEVGVDVPNANVMVIESAERFGLSQLHQLRGRVGRGSERSYCILMTGHKLSQESRRRIQMMCNTSDGFKLAEEDMKMRGPGDLEGTAQSGLEIDLHIASLYHDSDILDAAKDMAQAVLSADPQLQSPENQILTRQLSVLRKAEKLPQNFSDIS